MLVGVVLLAGCDRPAPAGCRSALGRAGTCGIGESCATSLDCESSNCAPDATGHGTCAASCTSAADCAMGTEICIAEPDDPGTRRHCTSTCPGTDYHVVGDTGELVCFEGRLHACSDLGDPGPFCDVCRCAAGERCWDPAGIECRAAMPACACLAPQPVGEPCLSNVGCISFNCSGSGTSPTRHCQVAAGAPCDATTDCIHCDDVSEATGATTCRQSCERDADCGTGICLALGDPVELACYVDCTVDGHCEAGTVCTTIQGDPRARRYCRPG